jgi:hypothetical protein
VVADYRLLIAKEVAADTRKLSSLEAFERAVADAESEGAPAGRTLSLREFADRRRAALLDHPELKGLAK